MQHKKMFLSCVLLSVAFAATGYAQDYTHLWNASKRVEFGLDQASKGEDGEPVPGTLQAGSGIPDVRVFPSTNPQDENSIAVNISNPLHLFISTNGRVPASNPVVHQTWFFSTNGGTSWFGSEDIPPGIVDCYGDPVAVFDRAGRAYYVTLGSPGGIYVVSTTNFGQTWSARTNADPLNSTYDDKEHAAADLSGEYPTICMLPGRTSMSAAFR